MQKTFVVINLAYIGDVMICSALCSEIKKNYPDSKLIFVTNAGSYQVAKSIPAVDEAVVFDKKGVHRGILGFFKFVKDFRYRGKIDCCFPIHSYDRGNILAFLLGAKRRISNKQDHNFSRFLLTDCLKSDHVHILDRTLDLIVPFTKKEPSSSMCCEADEESKQKAFELIKNAGYEKYDLVALCTNSKMPPKDWNSKDAAEFIELVNKSGMRVVWVGSSNSLSMVREVKSLIGDAFLDLINKTDISTLEGVLSQCKVVASVDTGTMHLSVAMKKTTLALFFVPYLAEEWAPRDKSFTRVLIQPEGISGQDAFEALSELLKKG